MLYWLRIESNCLAFPFICPKARIDVLERAETPMVTTAVSGTPLDTPDPETLISLQVLLASPEVVGKEVIWLQARETKARTKSRLWKIIDNIIHAEQTDSIYTISDRDMNELEANC